MAAALEAEWTKLRSVRGNWWSRGICLGQIAVAAFALSLITTEYASDVIRTTFAAMPRRGTVIIAKTLVGSMVILAAGLVASLASFLVGQPLLRASGFTEPAYPHVHLVDGPASRAGVGAAGYLAVLAVLALAVGVIVRRTAAATSAVLGLILVPMILAPLLPADVGDSVTRLTPTAGLAILQTRTDLEVPIGPWAGLGVICGWAVAALALWLVRRRDA